MDPPSVIVIEPQTSEVIANHHTQSPEHEDSLEETTPPPMIGRRRISHQDVLYSESIPDVINSESVDDEKAPTFHKLVKTVQFIKKWAGRAKKPHEERDEFLGRFKLTGPNIDDVYDTAKEWESSEEEGRTTLKNKKKLKQYLLWNPTGRWLYM